MNPENLIDLDSLCELGRFGKDGYRAMRRQGRTPTAYKIGRRLYFDRNEVELWLSTVRMVRIDPPVKPKGLAASA